MTKARDLGDNAQNTKPKVVDAKGDLIVGTGSDAADRLAAGSNGDTLLADSSASTGLRWQSDYAAGKNKVINGDFGIWQRGTSQLVISGTPSYGSTDRWAFARNGDGTGTNTVSRETFAVGQTDVPNNPTFYCRWTSTTLSVGQTRVDFNQYIEDVGTFANQTLTLSFYVKSSGTFGISTFFEQNFGSGGSTLVTTTAGTGNTSTSWTRFTTTVTLPSISGKTVGASNYLRFLIRFNNPTAGATFDVSNVQVEAGSVATAFQTATGTLQGELAACKYYFRRYGGNANFEGFGVGQVTSTTGGSLFIPFETGMRATPVGAYAAASNFAVHNSTGSGIALTSISTDVLTKMGANLSFAVASGLTAGNAGYVRANNTSSATIDFSAEL